MICEAEQYVMEKFIDRGYIYDEYGVMYIVQNIISIKMELIEEKYIPDKFDEFKVIVNQEEFENI